MTQKYDRQGNVLQLMEWAKLVEDAEYKRVAETTLPDGIWVSTVWMGLDYQFGHGPPLIFESMAFKDRDTLDELDVKRYSTEDEALAGHETMVNRWSKGVGP